MLLVREPFVERVNRHREGRTFANAEQDAAGEQDRQPDRADHRKLHDGPGERECQDHEARRHPVGDETDQDGPKPTAGPGIPAPPASPTIPTSSARWPPTSCSLGFTGSSPTSGSGPWASITGCAASTSNHTSMNSSSASTDGAPGTPHSD